MEFNLTPSFKHSLELRNDKGLRSGFVDYVIFHLAISVNGLCCPKDKFGVNCAELRLMWDCV